jgi:hypothetical protein
MPELFTKVDIPKSDFSIDYRSRLYFTGSCFAESIGLRFEHYKFPVCINPFGVQYNPLAISQSIHQIFNKELFKKEDLHFENELWFSFSHYTLFSDIDQSSCLEKINTSFSNAKQFICNANVIIITLGTSWTYIHKEDGQVVSNCHKLPANRFDRVFTSTDQSFEKLKTAIELIRSINPYAKFIFTVSPIRHWKDGAIENQCSKAALLLAVAKLVREIKDIYYFPAYEIMMDELRDYRFYAIDMLHPSDQATEYIWERFLQTYFTDETLKILSEIQRMIASIDHRPIHTTTSAYKKFIDSLKVDLENLSKKYPFIDLNKEYMELQKRVN